MPVPEIDTLADVSAKMLPGLSVIPGGDGGGAGGGAGGSGEGGGGDGDGGTGGGGDGGGGGVDGGGGDGSGGIGLPASNACSDTPATTEKWPSFDGFASVAWHSLYTPTDGRVTVTAPDVTAPP